MPLYEPKLVDQPTKEALLQTLPQYNAKLSLNVLDQVWWKLLVGSYPLEETYLWLNDGKPAPPDLYARRNYHFDQRPLLYAFWSNFTTEAVYDPPQQRLPDGTKLPWKGNAVEELLHDLRRLPFAVAMNTWLAVCVVLLQICNADWCYEEARKQGKPLQASQVSPQYLAGLMAFSYF